MAVYINCFCFHAILNAKRIESFWTKFGKRHSTYELNTVGKPGFTRREGSFEHVIVHTPTISNTCGKQRVDPVSSTHEQFSEILFNIIT